MASGSRHKFFQRASSGAKTLEAISAPYAAVRFMPGVPPRRARVPRTQDGALRRRLVDGAIRRGAAPVRADENLAAEAMGAETTTVEPL